MKLLVLVLPEFQDVELVVVTSILKSAQIFETIDFYSVQKLKFVAGQFNIANVEVKNEIVLENYDAIYVPGGKAATYLRSDRKSLKIISHFFENDKFVFAICDAPNAIYEKILAAQKHKYISWNSLENMQNLPNRITDFVQVFQDGKYISAKNSLASFELALKIVEVFKGAVFKQNLIEKLSGK